ncbi:uncharacterized protein PpBr36_09957 [Pyricularia pennisetigena]|uniref:uncharacterized protein n=1 Tax=Pyricularia pennisetigena TaxID=1578925 RepID=UPI00114EC84E|nr:uncharacterized protein PpBr36_09957 [Pyricularia pennisetigena]TLS22539.1 hypothetical protein PpBr36_09957 [Pyricularia pennisetigena]
MRLPQLTVWLAATAASSVLAQSPAPPVFTDTGDSALAFDLSQVTLNPGRFRDNQDRTLTYIKFVDLDRLLYNFRANHGLSTNGAQANGGWDAPSFPFRTHIQGHFLTAWANCWAVLKDEECRGRAERFVEELAKCQDNNAAAGFQAGYLSGFPESDITAVEQRTLSNGNVPYYAIHKTMAGLLDVWRNVGSTKARDVLLKMAGWVDARTALLSYAQMQSMMGTEFGGMSEVLADVFHQTGDERWLTAARRFDHAAVLDPLARSQDALDGLHANTQVPKWIGAAREYKATKDQRYLDIARNAWDFTVEAHTYAIGGNSQAEHFRPPNAIAGYLTRDTAEACNTYNMLKLTRELFMHDAAPAMNDTAKFDFYERALLNHLLGQQDPADAHGHVTYFTPLNAGGRRGVGPAWGGGTWSTDYESFWCCQGTGIETNTKLMDSIYFRSRDNTTLYVNLFIPSAVRWQERDGVVVTQQTEFPLGDTTTLTLSGAAGGRWTLSVRIPSWVAGSAEVRVNGQNAAADVRTTPGGYAAITREWSVGDKVTVRLPMKLHTVPANDDPSLVALAYGPAILSGRYGDQSLNQIPTLDLGSVKSTGKPLEFAAKDGNGTHVNLGPFYDAHGINYNVYWRAKGALPTV